MALNEFTNGYALALFSLAKEDKKLSQYKNDALAIADAMEGQQEVITLLNKKTIELDDRLKIVKKAFGKSNKNIVNTINILVTRAKAHYIVKVMKKLIALLNEAMGVNEGVVYSTEKLTDAQLKAITAKASKQLNIPKLVLINKLDAELGAGFRVVANDETIEDSTVSRLEQIKEQLLRGEN